MMKKYVGIAFLLVSDILSIILILQIAITIRVHILPNFHEFPPFPDVNFLFFSWIIPIWIFFMAYEGLYTRRLSLWDEVKVIWRVCIFSTVGMFSVLYLGKVGEKVSRTVLVLTGLLSIPLMPLIRLSIKRILINSGLLRSKAIILGAGETGKLILKAIRNEKNLGINVVGFVDDDPEKIGARIDGIRVHAKVDSAYRYIGRAGIEDVIIAMPGCERKKLMELIIKLQHRAKNLLVIPDLFGIAVLGTNLQHFFQEQVIGLEVTNNLARPINIFIKRIFDYTVGIFLLIILAIPMAIISILIMATSRGPAIYTQERVGKGNKSFRCYKFRTMFSDADERLKELLETNEEARNEWNSKWKLTNDPRITKIGKFLRRTSLDELPQLFNVLKGDMSLVGPRPVTRKEIEKYYKDDAEMYFNVLPGITGLWQVSGRSNTSYAQRIALDSWYVRNWTLWLDIVILFKTVKVVLKREGAV